MASEIIAILKKRIKILQVIIGILFILLAASSAYNMYYFKTKSAFESKVQFYSVPDNISGNFGDQPQKKGKRSKNG